ncbi:MAG: hypothetical protein A2072_00015 [Nitrospirae bacterium GWC1_57_7]|jgi:rare lipoprotein A|nr:MAG: hypothetical protein A2072_00015 [Nitrospirae bacterium GWC1_57_7]OGW43796.1 MAG: hypothetical protein A2X57_00430 [Nitrospirae bacterium GWD2_57_8]HAR45879.1 septal ring lytic transglycosylase RlpA family lipoprotein [Nitrospiraceae bacterium]
MGSRLVLLSFAAILLASCAGGQRPGYSNKSAAPQPKGTQKPYTVMGQSYTPLRSHDGFHEAGIASWYGTDFHGKKTSNGERYDMHAMTAAHKTLPMNVHVRVRNIQNGKEIIVRINDRGPFVRGRVIDLSYAAAKKLGVDVTGTASVRVEALGYKEAGSAEKYRTANYDAGNFTVQAGSFTQYENARRLSLRLKSRYGQADIKKVRVEGTTFYRVLAGKFQSLEKAEGARAGLEAEGHEGSFVVALD